MSRKQLPSATLPGLISKPLTWLLLGFLLSYLMFFLYPLFLYPEVMRFPRYVPRMEPIGMDLIQMLSYCREWWVQNSSPYIGNNLYPPLTTVLFTPLLLVEFSFAYSLVSVVTLGCFIAGLFVLPGRSLKERDGFSILLLFLISGLFSYGLQFEIERGQFNVIAMLFVFLAIRLFHSGGQARRVAFVLFTLAIQLKVYPAIFFVLLLDRQQSMRKNAMWLGMLALVNAALLFVLGPQAFFDFLTALRTQAENPYLWQGNHSIVSFVQLTAMVAGENGLEWVGQYTGAAYIILLLVSVLCLLTVFIDSYRRKRNGVDAQLLFACALLASMLPSVSNDYKLPLLAAPAALLMSEFVVAQKSGRRSHLFLVFVFAAAFSSALYSYTNKPVFLWNNFPALFVLLLSVTAMSWLNRKEPEQTGNLSRTARLFHFARQLPR